MPLGGGLTLAGTIAGPLIGAIFGSSASAKAARQQQQAIQEATKQLQGDKEAAMLGVSNATSIGQGYANDSKDRANQVLGEGRDQQLRLYNPYVQAGTDSLSSLKELSGTNGELSKQFSFNPSDLGADPGYAFALKQGQDAIQRSAAARGGLFNTGTLKSLAGYTTGTANTYFNDAFSRAKQTFDTNRSGALSRVGALQNLAGFGMQGTAGSSAAIGNAATQIGRNDTDTGQFNADLGLRGAQTTGEYGLRTSDKIADLITQRGYSQGASTVGQANAWSKALQDGTKGTLQFLAGRKRENGGGGYSVNDSGERIN